jgi:hypothetical protein
MAPVTCIVNPVTCRAIPMAEHAAQAFAPSRRAAFIGSVSITHIQLNILPGPCIQVAPGQQVMCGRCARKNLKVRRYSAARYASSRTYQAIPGLVARWPGLESIGVRYFRQAWMKPKLLLIKRSYC